MAGTVVKEPSAPFPYFGGKRNAAQMVWNAFGDPQHYDAQVQDESIQARAHMVLANLQH